MKTKLGFSLVELIIVTGGLAGLALVGMNLNKNISKSIKKTEFDSETLLITNEIVGILSDSTKCMNTFGPSGTKSALSSSVNSINGKYYTVASGLSPTRGYGNAGVTIDSIVLSSNATDIAANVAILTINFNNKKIISSETIKSKIINIYVQADASGNITSCHSTGATSSAATSLWTEGADSNIYREEGNVGIGTNSPQAKLHISGEAKTSYSCTDGSGATVGTGTSIGACMTGTKGTSTYSCMGTRKITSWSCPGVSNSTISYSTYVLTSSLDGLSECPAGAICNYENCGSTDTVNSPGSLSCANSLNFLIGASRAGIGVNNPSAELDVNGTIQMNRLIINQGDTVGGPVVACAKEKMGAIVSVGLNGLKMCMKIFGKYTWQSPDEVIKLPTYYSYAFSGNGSIPRSILCSDPSSSNVPVYVYQLRSIVYTPNLLVYYGIINPASSYQVGINPNTGVIASALFKDDAGNVLTWPTSMASCAVGETIVY